jgi:hypothetical protein
VLNASGKQWRESEEFQNGPFTGAMLDVSQKIAPRVEIIVNAAMSKDFSLVERRLGSSLDKIKDAWQKDSDPVREFVWRNPPPDDHLEKLSGNLIVKWIQSKAAKEAAILLLSRWFVVTAKSAAVLGTGVVAGTFSPDLSIKPSEGQLISGLSPAEASAMEDLQTLFEVADAKQEFQVRADAVLRPRLDTVRRLLLKNLAYEEARRRAREGE